MWPTCDSNFSILLMCCLIPQEAELLLCWFIWSSWHAGKFTTRWLKFSSNNAGALFGKIELSQDGIEKSFAYWSSISWMVLQSRAFSSHWSFGPKSIELPTSSPWVFWHQQTYVAFQLFEFFCIHRLCKHVQVTFYQPIINWTLLKQSGKKRQGRVVIVMHLRNTALLVMNECRLVNILNHAKKVSHLFAFCKTLWSLINKFFCV